MAVVEDIQLAESVHYFLSTLNPKEESIMRMRYGIGVQDQMTLEEVGVHMDLTRERIRQIESATLRKIKHSGQFKQLLCEIGDAPQTKSNRTTARPKSPDNVMPLTIDVLLEQAHEIGMLVEDRHEDEARRQWIQLKTIPDKHARKIIRKLHAFGFQFKLVEGNKQ